MLLDQAEQEMCLVVVVSSDVLDGFPHPLGHPEQVSVEAVLSIAVAAFTPRHDAHLVPAVLLRILHTQTNE